MDPYFIISYYINIYLKLQDIIILTLHLRYYFYYICCLLYKNICNIKVISRTLYLLRIYCYYDHYLIVFFLLFESFIYIMKKDVVDNKIRLTRWHNPPVLESPFSHKPFIPLVIDSHILFILFLYTL